jgi:DNA-binding transcriptional LysR family regulator
MHFRMDWRSLNFDWNRTRAFLATAEEGSFSAAARALGLAQPTLGRQVEALEAELGVVLFERVGRGLVLTPSGHALAEHARAMGQAASRLSMAAFGQGEEMAGPVSISVSDLYAGLTLPPIIARLRREEPRIRIELIATSTPSDLLAREADIAIRNFRPSEPGLVARKLRDARARFYASCDYLDAFGPITTPADLSRADFIGVDNTGMLRERLRQMGLNLGEGSFPVSCESYLVVWEMVKQGLGIGILDERIAAAAPHVREVLPGFAHVGFPVWLVAHRDIHRNRRLRFTFDFLAEALK